MMAVPAETAVTTPTLLTVATAVSLELNTTFETSVALVPLLNVPIAVNCVVNPAAIELAAACSVTDSSAAAVTTTCVVPEQPPDVAVMIAVPAETAVTTPVLLTVATATLLELNTTPDVRVELVPPLNDPMAVSWEVRPTAMELAADVTVMDSSAAATTTTLATVLTP